MLRPRLGRGRCGERRRRVRGPNGQDVDAGPGRRASGAGSMMGIRLVASVVAAASRAEPIRSRISIAARPSACSSATGRAAATISMAAGRRIPAEAPSRQPGDRSAEHARRRQLRRRQVHGGGRAEGRHRARQSGADAGARQRVNSSSQARRAPSSAISAASPPISTSARRCRASASSRSTTFAAANTRSAHPAAARPRCSVPSALNAYGGAKFKIVRGYKGTNRDPAGHGARRGRYRRRLWLARHAGQSSGLDRQGRGNDDLSGRAQAPSAAVDVPTLPELAVSDEGRAVLRAVASTAEIGRSIITTPGVPEDASPRCARRSRRCSRIPTSSRPARNASSWSIPAPARRWTRSFGRRCSCRRPIVAKIGEVLNRRPQRADRKASSREWPHRMKPCISAIECASASCVVGTPPQGGQLPATARGAAAHGFQFPLTCGQSLPESSMTQGEE